MPVTSSNAAAGSITGAPRRQYVSIQPFNVDFYTYTTSTNFVNGQYATTGSLSQVSGANSYTCPEGRVLRENGKKLFPDANPGVPTFMVGVYDSTTFLSGFIDPNSRRFQPQSTDLPTYLPNPVDSQGQETTDLGPGVYTRGQVRVTREGAIQYYEDISGQPYAGIYTDGELYPYIEAGRETILPGGGQVYDYAGLDGLTGNVYYTGLLLPRQPSGQGFSVQSLSSGVDNACSTFNKLLRYNPYVMVTRKSTDGGIGTTSTGQLSYTITNTSTLTITSSNPNDRYTCNYFLIGNYD
uniref:Uncharacterized protein n=1 Tax=viral metagenome TaxID=1070528 RepID=A0A6C0KXR4_9ZZZZ